MRSAPTRLLVIQPYVAGYQQRFFETLGERLAHEGVELCVLHSSPEGTAAARQDSVSIAQSRRVPSGQLRIGSARIHYKHTLAAVRQVRPDLVVLEQARGHVETYLHAMIGRLGGPPIAFWGHGRAYHRNEAGLSAWSRQALTMQGDWFFAYTQAGADFVVRHGFPAARVSVLRNTIDTDELNRDLASTSTRAVDEFRRLHGLTHGRTALFIGGIDEGKGIPFLLEAASIGARMLPHFRLALAGAGALVPAVLEMQAAGAPVEYLGPLHGRDKAQALAAADVLALPRGVGLVAVDSLVSGRPIVTTRSPGHGPELEYLEPGLTCAVSAATPMEFARTMTSLLSDTPRLTAMQVSARAQATQYSLTHMVDEFVEGILAWREAHESGLKGQHRLPNHREGDRGD